MCFGLTSKHTSSSSSTDLKTSRSTVLSSEAVPDGKTKARKVYGEGDDQPRREPVRKTHLRQPSIALSPSSSCPFTLYLPTHPFPLQPGQITTTPISTTTTTPNAPTSPPAPPVPNPISPSITAPPPSKHTSWFHRRDYPPELPQAEQDAIKMARGFQKMADRQLPHRVRNTGVLALA